MCTSGDPGDLDTTDEIVTSVLEDFINKGGDFNNTVLNHLNVISHNGPKYLINHSTIKGDFRICIQMISNVCAKIF